METISETFGKVRLRAKWRGNTNGRELVVRLDKDSVDRLKRLRGKIRTLDNDALIARGLECLEQKADRIIRRQISNKYTKLRSGADK